MRPRTMILAIAIMMMTAVSGFAQTDGRPDWTAPTGSWEGVVTNLQGGPPPFRVLMNFTADGGFTGSGDGDNAVGSPQYGVWQRVGDKASRTYAVTFRQLYYASDSTPTASATIRQTVILSESGDRWDGPFQVKIFAPDGTLVFTGSGTATARRIVSDPLPQE